MTALTRGPSYVVDYDPSWSDTRVWMAHHLYVCPKDSPELKRHLAFRDYLRRNPDVARAYGDLKLELAERFRNDREGYTAAKTEFVTSVLMKAM